MPSALVLRGERRCISFQAFLIIEPVLSTNSEEPFVTVECKSAIGIQPRHALTFSPSSSAGVSLALSIFDIFLEFYVILRTLSVLSPPFLSFRHRAACLRDPRFLKGVSLLILDLLTVAPL